jgi:hypothetical protein
MKKQRRWKRQAAAHVAAKPQQTGAQASAAAPVPGKILPAPASMNWRGIALDLAVIATNLFLLAPLARLLRAGGQAFLTPGRTVGGEVSPAVGWLFLSVFGAHALGAYLKPLPRQARLAARPVDDANDHLMSSAARLTGVSERTRRRRLQQLAPKWSPEPNKLFIGIVCGLLLAHFFIFLMLLFSGWQSTWLNGWSPLFGSKPADNTYTAFFVRFVLIIFILPLPTALVLVGLSTGGDAPPATWRTHWLTELLADLLLYFSIIVLTLILHVLIAPRFVNVEGVAGWTMGNVLASLIPLALAFSIFYLPPRLIYLAEDYKSPWAWLTILLALLSLAYRTFFPDMTSAW